MVQTRAPDSRNLVHGVAPNIKYLVQDVAPNISYLVQIGAPNFRDLVHSNPYVPNPIQFGDVIYVKIK